MGVKADAKQERGICEACGDVSEELNSCYLCGRLCCPSCLQMSGLCQICEEMQQDEVGL